MLKNQEKSIYSKENLTEEKLTKSLNLTKDPIGPLLKKIAIPASVGTLFQTLFNIVDTFFAGKFLLKHYRRLQNLFQSIL